MTMRPLAMRDVFLEQIVNAMAQDDKIFFVSADFGSPVLDRIRQDFPKRFVNVGIAEQNLINISAGLATEGFKVFAYAIASFITMRCYEQTRVSMALLSEVRPMNVTLIGVGAGYSYVVSGPTHQCYEDITLMRALPNVHVYSPADQVTTAALFEPCVRQVGIKYLRLDAQVLPVLYENHSPDIKQGFQVLREGTSLCILATGFMVHTALKVAEHLALSGLSVGVIDLFNITHFDTGALEKVLQGYQRLVTVEEGFRGRGGVDALMFEFLARRNLKMPMRNLGVAGGYCFELGSRADLHEHVGIGFDSMSKEIIEFSV